MRTFLARNPLYSRPRKKPRPLPVWFTLGDVAKVIGIRRNSAIWYVTSGQLKPAARMSSGTELFAEEDVARFVARRERKRKGA